MSYGSGEPHTPKGDYEAVPDEVATHTINDNKQQQQHDGLETGLFSSFKFLQWIPIAIVVVFVAVILPIGIYGASIMYGKPFSDIYDFKLDGNPLLRDTYKIVTSDEYEGIYSIFPVMVSITAKDGLSLISSNMGHGLAFRTLCGKIQAEWMMGTVPWLKQVITMEGYFMDSYKNSSYLAGDSNEQSVIKFGWTTSIVKQADLDNIKAYLDGTAFFQTNHYTYTIASPGLEEPGDVSVAVLIAFPIVYVIIYFFAVAARTSPFAFIVPLFSVTVTTVVSFGCLVWVSDSVKVTAFAIALSTATALSFSGASTIALMQRAASNASFDESFGRSVIQRIFLATTDIKFFLLFPFVTGTLFLLVSSIKDEAVRSISRSIGAACYITFFVNILLLPSTLVMLYSIVFREFPWWTKLMATLRLPLSMRRSTSEETETEQIMSAVRDVHSRNREKQEDTVFSRPVVVARSKPWVTVGVSTVVYAIFSIILLASSIHLLTDYSGVVSANSPAVTALRTTSQTYGTAVAVPYFFIIELSGPENKTEVSEDDFNLISQLTSDALNEEVFGYPQLDQLWSMASLEGTFISYQDYLNMVNTNNQSDMATQYRHLLGDILSNDLVYAAVKMYLPSKADCFEHTYAEFMMHVQNFATAFVRSYKGPPSKFIGAFGPSAGVWDAMNDVNDAFKVEVGLMVAFVPIIYFIVTRSIGASLFGFGWCILHVMFGMCFGAMTQQLKGFYYVSPPIVLMMCIQLFIFNDLGSLEIQIAIREQKRLSNDRIIIESLNQAESFRWHTLVVSITFFMLLFSLVDVVATVGISVAFMMWAETFVFRLFVYPAFLLLIERSGNVKRFFFFRSVAENVGELNAREVDSTEDGAF